MLLFFKLPSREYPRYENQNILASWFLLGLAEEVIFSVGMFLWESLHQSGTGRQMVQLTSSETRWASGECVPKADKGVIICLIWVTWGRVVLGSKPFSGTEVDGDLLTVTVFQECRAQNFHIVHPLVEVCTFLMHNGPVSHQSLPTCWEHSASPLTCLALLSHTRLNHSAPPPGALHQQPLSLRFLIEMPSVIWDLPSHLSCLPSALHFSPCGMPGLLHWFNCFIVCLPIRL